MREGLAEQIGAKKLSDTIRLHYKLKLPLFIHGGMGIGKSSIVRQTAREIAKENEREYKEWNEANRSEKQEIWQEPSKYFVLFDLRLSQCDPSDLKGLPKLNEITVEWLPTGSYTKTTSLIT